MLDSGKTKQFVKNHYPKKEGVVPPIIELSLRPRQIVAAFIHKAGLVRLVVPLVQYG
jgi:hypothetical protein